MQVADWLIDLCLFVCFRPVLFRYFYLQYIPDYCAVFSDNNTNLFSRRKFVMNWKRGKQTWCCTTVRRMSAKIGSTTPSARPDSLCPPSNSPLTFWRKTAGSSRKFSAPKTTTPCCGSSSSSSAKSSPPNRPRRVTSRPKFSWCAPAIWDRTKLIPDCWIRGTCSKKSRTMKSPRIRRRNGPRARPSWTCWCIRRRRKSPRRAMPMGRCCCRRNYRRGRTLTRMRTNRRSCCRSAMKLSSMMRIREWPEMQLLPRRFANVVRISRFWGKGSCGWLWIGEKRFCKRKRL